MKKYSSINELKEDIDTLSQLQSSQGKLLKDNFGNTIEHLKPYNLITEAIEDAINSPDLIKNLISTTLGITTGLITKQVFVGGSHNIFKKLLGSMIQYGVTAAIAINPDAVKSVGNKIINGIFSRHNNREKMQ